MLLLVLVSHLKMTAELLLVFTALHVMQTRYCDENSVCLSVRPSVRHTREL